MERVTERSVTAAKDLRLNQGDSYRTATEGQTLF